MSNVFSFEEQPFEGYSEFDLGNFESELTDSEWEEEIRRGAPFSPRGTTGYRQPGGPPRPMRHRPWPPKRRVWGYSPTPLFVDYRVEGEPAPCTCPVHGTEFVRWVQSSLNQVFGLRLPVTGIMNTATRSALRRFQEQQSLPVDGIAGPESKEALVLARGGKSASPQRAADRAAQREEISSDEKAQASANAARRAARESYDKYKRECKGVDLLRRLTIEPSDPTTKSARLRKRVEQVPELFRRIHLEDEKLREDLKHARSEGQRESLRKQHRISVARLLDQAGFDPRVKWTEESALAQARCELSEFNWIQYSLCSGKEVETPDRFARAVAEHYVRTETGLSLNGQTAKCDIHSVFCDVRFANGIVIRVNFSNIPDYFAAVQIAPRTGPKREYRYSCFRGQINLSPNQDALPAGGWPHQRRFSPPAQPIPAGPYQISRPTCEDLHLDLTELQSANETFSRSVELLDKLVKQKPRNEPLFKETAERAKKQRATLKIVLEKMTNRTRSGWYLRGDCSHKDIARVTCKISKLPGVWLRTPPIQPIKKLRDQLVSRLRHSRGAFKNVPCDRL